MFPARLLKTLRSHVYDTRAAAIIPLRGKGVRLLFAVCPREYATGAALFRQIRNDTLFLFSLFFSFFFFYEGATIGTFEGGILWKISTLPRRLGSSRR